MEHKAKKNEKKFDKIAKKIMNLIEKQGVKKTVLARGLKIERSTLDNILSGKQSPYPSTIERIESGLKEIWNV